MKRIYLSILTVFLFLCFTNSAFSAAYTGADITIQADQFSDSSARWTTLGDGSIYTAWAGQWVTYDVALTEGNWDIGLNVINHGNLGTDWYSEFKIHNSLTEESISITASDDTINSGSVNVDLDAGIYNITYTWLNDQYAPPLDANIQITSVFFDDTATAPVPEPGTMFLLGTGLFGLVGLKRKKKQQ